MLGQRGGRQLRCTHSSFYDRGFERSFYVIDDLTHELWATEKKAYDTLIRTLSHEVNNTLGATNSILHSVVGYGEQLDREDRRDFGTALEVAIERAEHLTEFMQRYAEVARLPEPNVASTKIHELLMRIVRLMEPEARERGISIEMHVIDDLAPVRLDVVQMEQALINIMRNALEAIDRDGMIAVNADTEAARTRIVIEDDGPGLDPEARDNLFVPFFSTKPGGQGVGLTLVRKILSNHGFDFTFDSTEGGPTRFVILLS
jgi:signal transduction histidine kinase